MITETLKVMVLEKIHTFNDCWDYSKEAHYTKDFIEDIINNYVIEVELDDEGDIITPPTEIRNKVYSIADGEVIDYWLEEY